MENDEIFDKIADSRQTLMEAIDGLDGETISTIRWDQKWTVKDLLAHIIAWDESCLEPLRKFGRGEPFAAEEIKDHNAWNAQQVERWSARPLETVLRELTRVRLELLAAAQQVDERSWKVELQLPWGEKGTVAHILSGLAWHENEHAKEILKWRGQGQA